MIGVRLSLAIALLGAVLGALNRPALADDWEFAKWGMTVEEVRTAAAGKATSCDEQSCKNKSNRTARAILTMPMTLDGFEMAIFFAFDRKTERLTSVGLQPKNESDNDRWLREMRIKLKKTYGPWKEVPWFNVTLWNWELEEDGGQIQLMAQTEADPENVYLSYTSKEGMAAKEADE